MTAAGAAMLPLDPPPDDIEWTLPESAGRFNPLWGYSVDQRVRYGTARWRASIKYTRLTLEHRAALRAFVGKVGTHRPFWVVDFSNDIQGSWALSELISSPNVGATWTGDTGRTVTTDTAGVRVTKTSTTASGIGLTSAVNVTSGAIYAFRAVRERGGSLATISTGIRAGSSQFGNQYGSVTAAATDGRQALRCTPSAGTMFVGVSDSLTDASNWPQAPYYALRGLSVCRAFQVHGGTSPTAQTGSGLYVDGADASINGLLKAGDMVEIVTSGYGQLLRLVEDMNTNSSGQAFIRFEPGLRGQTVDNELLIPFRPMARMMLLEEPPELTRPARYITDVKLKCEEAFGD